VYVLQLRASVNLGGAVRFCEETDDAVELSRQGVEVWRPVVDCPERYFVSNLGRVISRARERPEALKNTVTAAGYYSVGVYARKGEPPDTRLVHRMVIDAFVGGPPTPKHTDVRHLDGDGKNCSLYNLAWGTRSENMTDVWNHRKLPAAERKSTEVSIRSWYSSVDASDRLVEATLELMKEGKLNIRDASRLWGCSAETAAAVVHGTTNRPIPPELVVEKKSKRSSERKAAVAALAAAGRGFKEINELLGETLTAQDVYYYRTKSVAPR
jgi:hypothetical protein